MTMHARNTIKYAQKRLKGIKFSDIKQFPHCSYHVDIGWNHLEDYLERSASNYNLNLDPDFQRAHVWKSEQQSRYCEYILQGGRSGKELYFNCPSWENGSIGDGDYVIVDGKQRLQAVRRFMAGKIKVFGHFFGEHEDSLRPTTARFSWNVASIEKREDVLKWYLNFNSGGSVHTESELQKVRDMIRKENA